MAVSQLNEVVNWTIVLLWISCCVHTVDEADEDPHRQTSSLPVSDSFLSANIQNMPPKLRCIHSTWGRNYGQDVDAVSLSFCPYYYGYDVITNCGIFC